MFYGHSYTIVTVHSIKDCLDQPLHHSYVTSSMIDAIVAVRVPSGVIVTV